MGVWGTIARAALKYGPYAAAPFTGGASLAAIPVANQITAQMDKDAAGKPWGVTPPRGMNVYGSSGQTGEETKVDTSLPYNINGQNVSLGNQPIGPSTVPSVGASNPTGVGSQAGGGNIFKPLDSYSQPRGLFSQKRGMMPEDSSNPNLSFALNQGKRTALQNQPWRRSAGIYPRIGQKKPIQTEVTEA